MPRFKLKPRKTTRQLGKAIRAAGIDHNNGSPNKQALADAIKALIDHDPNFVKIVYDGRDDGGGDLVHIVVPDVTDIDAQPQDYADTVLGSQSMGSCAN